MKNNVLNALALIVILLAIVILWNDLKVVHYILFTSGFIYFGLKIIKKQKNEAD